MRPVEKIAHSLGFYAPHLAIVKAVLAERGTLSPRDREKLSLGPQQIAKRVYQLRQKGWPIESVRIANHKLPGLTYCLVGPPPAPKPKPKKTRAR
jgi:hypothetical protein